MKKLLILGSSFGSSEVIRKARKRGWYTIVTDNLPPERSPAKQVSDDGWMISTTEIGTLKEKCRKEKINAVFAGVSEFNLDRVRILAEELNLPCYIDKDAWAVARNKRLFKQKCMEKNIPVVPEYPVPTPGDESGWERIGYPVVVKPVDGTGNAGLSICHNREELEKGIAKARAVSEKTELILEKYVTGEETWNHYVIADGRVQYLYSMRAFKQPGYPTYLYSFGTSAAGEVDDYLNRMNPQCAGLIREIGCREGVAWIQCIRDAEGNWYALEMAHRMSAEIGGDKLEKCLGFNEVEWMLDTALGIRHRADSLPDPIGRTYTGAMCGCFLFSDHAGRIVRMEGFDQLDPSVFQVEMTRYRGDEVRQYQLMAKIVFFARSKDEMDHLLRQVNETVAIDDQCGRDLVIRYTDYDAVREEIPEFG